MKIKSLILGSAAVLGAAWLGACGTPQVHCLVVGSPSGSGAAYWMKYLNSDMSSACSQLLGEGIGFQVYNVPRTDKFTMAFRTDSIGLPISNGVTSKQIDDATTAGGCMGVGGCNSQENPTSNGSMTMPSFPTNNTCEMKDFVAAGQDFDAIPPTLDDDGGVVDPGAPATTISFNFTKLRFASSTNAPGTAFDGEVDFKQDACSFHYKVFGFWPQIACGVDADCNPVADPDAGYVQGSGINPTFQDGTHPIKCNKDVGVCELSYTSVDDINAIK
jgi:hypothetical protein